MYTVVSSSEWRLAIYKEDTYIHSSHVRSLLLTNMSVNWRREFQFQLTSSLEFQRSYHLRLNYMLTELGNDRSLQKKSVHYVSKQT